MHSMQCYAPSQNCTTPAPAERTLEALLEREQRGVDRVLQLHVLGVPASGKQCQC